MFKRLFALLCAVMMLAGIPVIHAEENALASFIKVPDTLTYRGGVVMRGYVKGADLSLPDLDVAYALTSMPYIILGQTTSWEFIVSGGSGDYTCEVVLAYQELSQDPFVDSWAVPDWFPLSGRTFNYTFDTEGRYFWEFRVMDSSGAFLVFQSRIYETYTKENETDDKTTVGKANSVVAEVIKPGMSIYDRARKLHDWLIYNANYDYTFTHTDAAGVLLHGTGVCDSYARAYLMLCTIAGIDCIYVSGTAGYGDPSTWESHGWNMIRLDDGKWYHVDCTWDDPGTGGSEHHQYFCVDDETLAQDHRWNRPDSIVDAGFLPPESEDGEYETETVVPAITPHFTFSNMDEYCANLDLMAAAGTFYSPIYAEYTGSKNADEFFETSFDPRIQDKANELFEDGFLLEGTFNYGIMNDLYFYLTLPWATPTPYINILETNLRVSIDEKALIIPAEYSPASNAFTWTSSDPSIATVTATYSDTDGLIATVTGVSAGTVTITVKPAGGLSDTVTVTVMPAYAPDFDFTLKTADGKIQLDWNSIPGITEYQIIRVADGKESILATTHNSEYELTSSQLPSNASQTVYILAQRKVADAVVASYKSDAIPYGKFTPTFTSSLPDAMEDIGAEAFADCTKLTSFDIPSGVTAIGERAFAGCTSLKTIRIPASVKSIGAGAFNDCPLQYAVVEKGSFADLWLQECFANIQLIY